MLLTFLIMGYIYSVSLELGGGIVSEEGKRTEEKQRKGDKGPAHNH